MKTIAEKTIVWLLLALLIVGCAAQRGTVRINSEEEDLGVTSEDSVEYEMETFDSKFETWYALQKSPANYRSEPYYENWNQQYVDAWNNKALSSNSKFFEPIIGWDPTVDYEFEIDHELFYYFQYVEHVLKIQILPSSPKSIIY